MLSVESPETFAVVVCASGGGGNLRAVLEGSCEGDYLVKGVITDRACGAEEVARGFGLEPIRVSADVGEELWLNFILAIPPHTDLLVLAGFMPILKGEVLSLYSGKIINTHPSLLPKFGGYGMYGVRVHEAVLASGDKETGCTVHFVTADVDSGPILAQKKVAVDPNEAAWDLGARVFALEGPLLVEVITSLARGGEIGR